MTFLIPLAAVLWIIACATGTKALPRSDLFHFLRWSTLWLLGLPGLALMLAAFFSTTPMVPLAIGGALALPLVVGVVRHGGRTR